MEVVSLGVTNFVSHLEYQIQNFVFAVIMLGVIYNQYKIRRMIKDLLSGEEDNI